MNGDVIAPDDFRGELERTYADYADLAAINLVFLPAAGYRTGYNVYYGDRGDYWSSSAYNGYYTHAVGFDVDGVGPGRIGPRSSGYCVRLVTEIK